jgi:hypothetical protein
MGKLYSEGSWEIRVFGKAHPPVHAHVMHPEGEAALYLDGETINSGVPRAVLARARAWAIAHPDRIRAEWEWMGNPMARRVE